MRDCIGREVPDRRQSRSVDCSFDVRLRPRLRRLPMLICDPNRVLCACLERMLEGCCVDVGIMQWLFRFGADPAMFLEIFMQYAPFIKLIGRALVSDDDWGIARMMA